MSRMAGVDTAQPEHAKRALTHFGESIRIQIVLKKENGRSERIRTSGPYVPNVVLYQAELHSESWYWKEHLIAT